MGGAKKSQKS